MDKDTLIRMLNNGNFNEYDIATIVAEYCLEKGKQPKDVSKFITEVLPYKYQHCLSIALDYFKNKYEITTVLDENCKILIHY